MVVSACIGTSTMLGVLINSATNQVFGIVFLTLLFVFLGVIALGLGFGISPHFTTIFCVPLALTLMVCTEQFLAIGGALLIYLALVFASSFPIK